MRKKKISFANFPVGPTFGHEKHKVQYFVGNLHDVTAKQPNTELEIKGEDILHEIFWSAFTHQTFGQKHGKTQKELSKVSCTDACDWWERDV